MPDQPAHEILAITAQIVTAHISNNALESDALLSLIQSVYRSLLGVSKPEPVAEAAPTPAVPVKKSVFPDFIVCLEDGKKLKMLKRHLQTRYGMSPDAYRTKWSLPQDYPMVAPNYAAIRSGLAKRLGLGRKRAGTPAVPEVTQLPGRRARGSKG